MESVKSRSIAVFWAKFVIDVHSRFTSSAPNVTMLTILASSSVMHPVVSRLARLTPWESVTCIEAPCTPVLYRRVLVDAS